MRYVCSCKQLLSLFMVISFLLPFSTYALPTPPVIHSTIKSFHEWKNSKVTEVENRIHNVKDKMAQQQQQKLSGKDPNLAFNKNSSEAGLSQMLQNQLDQELMNLSMSHDLTISDYFVGYLTKQSSLDAAIKEVSGRLSAEEVAELMSAFAEHFFQTRPPPVKEPPRADSGQ